MNELSIYEFSYKGIWLGGHILIIASSEENATEVAKQKVVEQDLNPDTLILMRTKEIKEGYIIYNDNGDY